jgi:hypothetical protein
MDADILRKQVAFYLPQGLQDKLESR